MILKLRVRLDVRQEAKLLTYGSSWGRLLDYWLSVVWFV